MAMTYRPADRAHQEADRRAERTLVDRRAFPRTAEASAWSPGRCPVERRVVARGIPRGGWVVPRGEGRSLGLGAGRVVGRRRRRRPCWEGRLVRRLLRLGGSE